MPLQTAKFKNWLEK